MSSYFRPPELRVAIEEAYSGSDAVAAQSTSKDGSWGGIRSLDFDVPLFDSDNLMGRRHYLSDVRVIRASGRTETLQSGTGNCLRRARNRPTKKLETTNEELQSTVEELETTNEELQSTNEELETMNEELQSTNEELQTVNNELRERTDDLQRANLFQESILESMQSGVVVLDGQLHVQIWNEEAEDLWGLRADEVKGRSFVNLDIGLPVSQLAETLRSCQDGQSARQSAILNAVNRRGKSITCRVTCSPLERSSSAVSTWHYRVYGRMGWQTPA